MASARKYGDGSNNSDNNNISAPGETEDIAVPEGEVCQNLVKVVKPEGEETANRVNANWIMDTLLSMSRVIVTKEMVDQVMGVWKLMKNKGVVKYLIDKDFLRAIQYLLGTKPHATFIRFVLKFLCDLCEYKEVVTAIGNSNRMSGSILNRVKSDHIITTWTILEMLPYFIEDIKEKKESSPWLTQFMAHCYFGDELTDVLHELDCKELAIKCIEVTHLMMPVKFGDTILLKEVFDMDELMPGLLNFFLGTFNGIASSLPHDVINKWLDIMYCVVNFEAINYVEYEREYREKTMVCLEVILEPYVNIPTLSTIERHHGEIIVKALELASWFNDRKMVVDPNLILIAARLLSLLIQVVGAIEEADEEENESIVLLRFMQRYWMQIYGHFDTSAVAQLVGIITTEILDDLKKMLEYAFANRNPSILTDEKVALLKSCLGAEF